MRAFYRGASTKGRAVSQSTLEWQYGSSINRRSTWVAGKHAWIGVHGSWAPLDLDRMAASVLVLVLVPLLVHLWQSSAVEKVQCKVPADWCAVCAVCGVVLEKSRMHHGQLV